MSGAGLMDLSADAAVLLRAAGWRADSDGRVLEEPGGAQWAVASAAGDSQLTAADGVYTLPFAPRTCPPL